MTTDAEQLLINLTAKIQNLVRAFEIETGQRLTEINVGRDRRDKISVSVIVAPD